MSNQAGSSRSSKPLTFQDFQRELKEFLKANPQLTGGRDTIYDLVIEADNEEDRARYSKRLSDMMAESYNRRKRSGQPPKKVKQPGDEDKVSKQSEIVPEIVLSSDDEDDDEVQVIDFEQDDGRVILSVKRGQDTKRGHDANRGQVVIKKGGHDPEIELDIQEIVVSSDSEDIELDEKCDDDDEVQVLSDTRIDLTSPGQSKSEKKSKRLIDRRLIYKSWCESQRRLNVWQANESASTSSHNASALVTSLTLKDHDDVKPDNEIVMIDLDKEDDDDVIEIVSESAMTTLSDSDFDDNDTTNELDLDPPSQLGSRPQGQLNNPPEGQLNNPSEGQEAISVEELFQLELEPMPAAEIPSDLSEDDPMEDDEALDLALSLQEEIYSHNDLQTLPKGPAGTLQQPLNDSSNLQISHETSGPNLSTSQGTPGPDLPSHDDPIEEEILSRLSNLLNLPTAPDTPAASPALPDRFISNLTQLLDLEEPSAGSKIGPTSLQLTSKDPQEDATSLAAASPVKQASTGGHHSDLERQAGAAQGSQSLDQTEPGALINSEGFLDLDQCLESDEVPNPEVLTALISNEPEGRPVTPAAPAATFNFVRPSSQIQAIPNRPRNKVTRKKKHQPKPPPLGSCIPTHQIKKPLGASAKKLDLIMNPNKKSRPLKPKKVAPKDLDVLQAPGPAFSLRIRPSTSKNIAAQKPPKPPVYVPRLPKTSFGPQLKPKNNFYILTCTLLSRTQISNWPERTEGQKLSVFDQVRPRRPEVPELGLIDRGPQGSRSPNI